MRTFVFMLGAAMVAATLMSAQGQFNQTAHEAMINRTPSAEVLKFHATIHARISVALDHADLPDMGVPAKAPRIITVMPLEKDKIS